MGNNSTDKEVTTPTVNTRVFTFYVNTQAA